MKTPQFKRSRCLVFYFKGKRLFCQNYLTGLEVATAPVLVEVLNALEDWRSLRKIISRLSGYNPGSVLGTLRRLVSLGLVVNRGSSQAKREEALAAWSGWEPEASLFHFGTKHAFRSGIVADEASYHRTLLKRGPQPPLFKRYPRATKVALPRPRFRLESEFPRVLLERRTHRQFAAGRVPLEDISALLRLTWGVTGRLHWPGLGKLLLKTSPSGGARHSIEVYLVALRVKGLAHGVYHYRADAHCLERLHSDATPQNVARMCGGQSWIGGAAALFVMTSVFPRVMWRYPNARAYRVVLLEAGHFCQTFCLAATWLGLAPFCTAAFRDAEMEAWLGIDGAAESVLYAAGVGLPRRTAPRAVPD